MPHEIPGRPHPELRRFAITRVLGSGGMGVVYEAVDREQGTRVALKTVRTLQPEATIRFKQEFRALADVHHPNLVRLGELLEVDRQLYLTMELVDGEDFVEYVRPRVAPAVPAPRAAWHWLQKNGERFDEARLRAAFRQLARGLHALHRADKIHRDIKPSNVLVTPSGRVVILDFGLVMDVGGERDGAIVGTAHFMAPEQAAGEEVGPPADWYSLGAMLYVALTGFYPFKLPPEVALDFKQQIEPVPPSAASGIELPEDLETLCVDLLRREPAARPSGPEILRRLAAEPEAEGPPRSVRSASFVGREGELAALHRALGSARAGEAVAVLIEGESGMGKSALLRRFLDGVRGGAVVLAGRCYEHESVPYKAVDELVDALARHLTALPPDRLAALLPPDAALLGDLFPALRMLPAIAGALRRSMPPPSSTEAPLASGAGEAIEPLRARSRVFTALRELLRRLASPSPLILAVDDLQWADADGLALLAELLRPPGSAQLPSPLLFVCTARPHAPATQPGALPIELQRIALGGLPRREARELALLLLLGGPAGRVPPEMDLDALVTEAMGQPLFIDALVRHRAARFAEPGPVRLEDALFARIERLDEPARRLLELCAIAGRPLGQALAREALGGEVDALPSALSLLRASGLVSTSGAGPAARVEPFHDRVRQAVLGRLAAPARRARHERLALALEAAGGEAELEALALHFREAGDRDRAAGYAVRAGDQAAAALAFDRAAELYRAAQRLHPPDRAERRDLLIKLGDALGNAGRCVEAAEAYQGASRAAPPALAIELKRRAAENLLRAGRVDEGVACLDAALALAEVPAPRTPARARGGLLLRRAQLQVRGRGFTPVRAELVPPEVLARIDTCWSAALGIGFVDGARAAGIQAIHLLLALEAGEPLRVARALALEAIHVAAAGGPAEARAAELLARAAAVARQSGAPHALAVVDASAGFAALAVGRLREALALFDGAEATLREHSAGVVWERALVVAYSAATLWLLGDLRELARRMPTLLREADERGDRFLGLNLRSGLPNAIWLAAGDPGRARLEADEAIRGASTTTFERQPVCDLVARCHIDLYAGDGALAHRRMVERWPALARSRALGPQLLRIFLTQLRGRAALAAARGSRERRALLEGVEGAARALEGERIAWADPHAGMLRAGLAVQRGDREGAAALLGRAARGFEVAEMGLEAAVARRRRGELWGGAQGAALVEAADAWMTGQGIVAPERMAAMVAPGFGEG